MFDLEAGAVVGLELTQLPIDTNLRASLVRRRKALGDRTAPMLLRNQELNSGRSKVVFDVHFTPLSRDGGNPSLLLMFAPQSPGVEAWNSTGRRATPKKGMKSRSTTKAGKKKR